MDATVWQRAKRKELVTISTIELCRWMGATNDSEKPNVTVKKLILSVFIIS